MSRHVWTTAAAVAAAFVGGMAGSALLQSPVAMAQNDNSKVLTASTINIVDAEGKARMVLGVIAGRGSR